MPIRIEIQPDGEIEIMRSWISDSTIKFLHFRNLDTAVSILRYLIKREIRRVERDRFIPQIEKEAAKLINREVTNG
jgi:hypothetical protein